MTEPHWQRVGLTALLASLSHVLVAQIGTAKPAAIDRATKLEARRLVTFLEIPARRRNAARALRRMGAAAAPELARVLADPRHEVVFRAARLLRALGPDARAALPALTNLGRSKDERLAEAAKWAMVGIEPRGLVLVCDSKNGVLFGFDRRGKKTLEVPNLGGGLYDADLLANDSFLICQCNSNSVSEVDRKGKKLWEYKEAGRPVDVDRLANGNTLISGGRAGKVWEVDRAGKIVWEFATKWPNEADRLPSGNTLISDAQAKRAVEVDPSGQVVWEYKAPSGTIDAERLNNGNTLLVLGGNRGVVEVDEDGKTVWQYEGGAKAHSASRLHDGHTLLAGQKGVLEVDADSKTVWQNSEPGRAASAVGY